MLVTLQLAATDTLRAYVGRLIGTVRREYLDRILFWTATDLETKLAAVSPARF